MAGYPQAPQRPPQKPVADKQLAAKRRGQIAAVAGMAQQQKAQGY